MLSNWLWDIVAVDGKIAAGIREKRSLLVSPFIVLIAAQIHGLTAFYCNSVFDSGQINLTEAAFYFVFGYMAMIASQLGIALLLWVMGKLLGGRASRFIDVFIAAGYAFLPYGILAAANTYYRYAGQGASFSSNTLPVIIMFAAFVYFTYLLTRVLHLLTGFTIRRAFACVAAAFVFIASFVYLFGY